jgi:hypothetical protein
MITHTMATTTPITPTGTPLSRHDCPSCGAPISLRQEAIGEALLKLASATSDNIGLDIDGDCTPLYCIACLETMLDDDARRAELARLKAFIDEADVLLA